MEASPAIALGGDLGGAIGSLFGQKGSQVGRNIGSLAGGIFKRITGVGDYEVKKNTVLTDSSPPMFGPNGRGVVVRHREYLGDVSPTVNFTVKTYPINAGLSTTFPWLAQTAAAFEQYRVLGMVFEYKSLSSDAVLSSSASSSLGAVIMSTQYNVYDPIPTSKVIMENYLYANSSKPSMNILHPIECDNTETPTKLLYVRQADIGGDYRLYDLGNFSIATSGMQNTAGVIGELWVTYEIEFYKPKQLGIPASVITPSDHYQFYPVSVSGGIFGGPGNPSPTKTNGSSLGTSITASVPTYFDTINFPTAATYMVHWTTVGTSASIAAGALLPTPNLALLQFWVNDTQSATGGPLSGSSNFLTSTAIVRCSGAGPWRLRYQGWSADSGWTGDLFITLFSPSVTA